VTSVEERGEEPHRLRVVKSGPGNVHKVEIDGHVVMPTSMTVEFLEAAEYVIAKMTLPCFVENLDALTVLDISLDEPQRPERDEC
jgi:hypothetical protein